MFAIDPPSGPINFTASLVVRSRPVTFRLKCFWMCSGVIDSSGANSYVPALFLTCRIEFFVFATMEPGYERLTSNSAWFHSAGAKSVGRKREGFVELADWPVLAIAKS